MASQEELIKRGKILKKRLELLNEFIFSEKTADMPFSAFLQSKKINEEIFLSDLPASLVQPGIGNVKPDSKKLFDYTKLMNDVYVQQYSSYLEGQTESADGEEDMDGEGWEEVDGEEEASGDNMIDVSEMGSEIGSIADDEQMEDEFYSSCDGCKYLNASAGSIAKCNLKYPPPRGKKRRGKYQDCLREEDAKRDERKKPPPGITCGPGEKWNRRKKKCVKRGRFLNKANKFNPAMVLVRKSFLSIVSLNLFGIASALKMLSKKDPGKWTKVAGVWFKIGGTDRRINIAVNRGSKKKMFPKLKKRHRADGVEEYYFDYSGSGDEPETAIVNKSDTEKPPKDAGKLAATAAGGLAGAAGALAAIPGAQPVAVWVGASAPVIAVLVPLLKSFAKEKGEDTTDIPETPPPDKDLDPGNDEDHGKGGKTTGGTFFEKHKIMIYASSAAVASLLIAIVISMAIKAKKK